VTKIKTTESQELKWIARVTPSLRQQMWLKSKEA